MAWRETGNGVAVKYLSDRLIIYSLPLENEGETLCLTTVYQLISRHGPKEREASPKAESQPGGRRPRATREDEGREDKGREPGGRAVTADYLKTERVKSRGLAGAESSGVNLTELRR